MVDFDQVINTANPDIDVGRWQASDLWQKKKSRK